MKFKKLFIYKILLLFRGWVFSPFSGKTPTVFTVGCLGKEKGPGIWDHC